MQIFHGTIITCDKGNNVCKYLVEEKGKIQFTGDVLPDRYRLTEITELGNRVLLPSFGDTHMHFSSYALFSSTLNVQDAGDISELEEMISDYARENQGNMILGFGISAHSLREKRLITRKELDRVCPDRPVMLIKYDGHACIVNSSMLKKLPAKTGKLRGFDKETGALLNEAFFAATDYISSRVPIHTLLNYLLRGVDRLAESGTSMVHTAEGVGFPLDLDVDLIRFLARGISQPLQFRIFFQTMSYEKALKRKLPRVGGCFATALDGCFGSLDAALSSPYASDENNRGILFYTDKQVNDFVSGAHKAGLQVQLHAIGDAAFDQAITAFSRALDENPREDHRHSIIHACLASEKSLRRCGELGVGIAAQPAFLSWPMEPMSYIEEILGKRARQISPYKTMLDMGIHVSGGSDAPCTSPDPIGGIHALCNHPQPDQSIPVMDAIRMFTWETARAAFDEHERGSLEPGKIADMVMLNKNPLTMPTAELKDIKVEALLLNGKMYKKGQTRSSLLLGGLKESLKSRKLKI